LNWEGRITGQKKNYPEEEKGEAIYERLTKTESRAAPPAQIEPKDSSLVDSQEPGDRG